MTNGATFISDIVQVNTNTFSMVKKTRLVAFTIRETGICLFSYSNNNITQQYYNSNSSKQQNSNLNYGIVAISYMQSNLGNSSMLTERCLLNKCTKFSATIFKCYRVITLQVLSLFSCTLYMQQICQPTKLTITAVTLPVCCWRACGFTSTPHISQTTRQNSSRAGHKPYIAKSEDIPYTTQFTRQINYQNIFIIYLFKTCF